MGQLIQLSKYRTSEQQRVVVQRGYTRFLIRNHRRMQERDEKRLQDQRTDK